MSLLPTLLRLFQRPLAGIRQTTHLGGIKPLCTLRVARPTNDIDALMPFYVAGLALSVLARFHDHDGFDGVVVGSPGAPYHFEFTTARSHVAPPAPTQDHLAVFYIPPPAEWRAAVARMQAAGFDAVPSFNPCWDRQGATFQNTDGLPVLLQRAAWLR